MNQNYEQKIKDSIYLSKSYEIKSLAFYSHLGFREYEEFLFEKKYDYNRIIQINAIKEEIEINKVKKIFIIKNYAFSYLECINKLFEINDLKNEISFGKTNYFMYKKIKIICFSWDKKFPKEIENNQMFYQSRMISGSIEYKFLLKLKNKIYNQGFFNNQKLSYVDDVIKEKGDFLYQGKKILKYLGKAKKVFIPNGVKELLPSCFWDNQHIEEVIFPESMIDISGDTFFNCQKLKKITITKNIKLMGDNPFAGCPLLNLKNESSHFIYENGVLYSENRKKIIHYSINNELDIFKIPDDIEIIGKHAFFLNTKIREIVFPNNLRRLENNPFSGCSNLTIKNNSSSYFIKDDVIYNKNKTIIVGCLNKIKTARLELLEGVKRINRNVFWNCKEIEEIILPSSIIDIGYNPFVNCEKIKFNNKSSNYQVIDNILYSKDLSKLICYPCSKKEENLELIEEVIFLERGAFSGNKFLKKINLKNVNFINKTSFANCKNLKELYCSDLITFIGEWAFAHCLNLEKISLYYKTHIDNNAFSNCDKLILEKRKVKSNYAINSNNIFSLKGMQNFYKNKIDAILIDPPYNSNVSYINYQDANFEGGFENFLDKRIQLAYKLLSRKGYLVINIDEDNLKFVEKVCLKYFSKSQIEIRKWKKIHYFFDTNRVILNKEKKQTDFEYIVFCKMNINLKLNKINQPFLENNELHESINDVPEIFDCFGTTSSAKDEIEKEFGDRTLFSTPKPVKLMKELIRATTNENSIVLDFFAGSGTTGVAVMELNKETNSKRNFILISNNEGKYFENILSRRIEKNSDVLEQKVKIM